MVDVSEATFEAEVLERSEQVPVVVDLWADWCGPCKTLGPILEDVIDETDGQVALVDAAVLGPNDGTVPYKSTPDAEDAELTADTLATMASVRDLVRRTQPFGRPPVIGAPPTR